MALMQAQKFPRGQCNEVTFFLLYQKVDYKESKTFTFIKKCHYVLASRECSLRYHFSIYELSLIQSLISVIYKRVFFIWDRSELSTNWKIYFATSKFLEPYYVVISRSCRQNFASIQYLGEGWSGGEWHQQIFPSFLNFIVSKAI